MDRVPIEIDTFHHVYNRGTDKRIIFAHKEDYLLFLKYLYLLNDTEVRSPTKLVREFGDEVERAVDHEPLVEIVAYCLMHNHFHLLLYEITENGISKFMHRLGTAYTMYFNEKYERSGALFQGRFKSRLIDDEQYLLKIIDYIHLNPAKNVNSGAILETLRKYNWSSARNYNDLTLPNRIIKISVLNDYTEIPNNYFKWLSKQNDFEDTAELLIDNE